MPPMFHCERNSEHVKTRMDSSALISGSASVPASTRAPLVDLRILGVGDSITWGYGSREGDGYFRSLCQHLSTHYLTTRHTFIGSKTSFSGHYYHEGYPGFGVRQIQRAVVDSGTLAQRPNLILLMAGTNDLCRGTDPAKLAEEELKECLEVLFDACPDAAVLVSQVPPIGREGRQFDAAWRYNRLVGEMVEREREEKGKHVVLVEQDLRWEHMCDGLHPNDKGHKEIASGWWEGIQKAVAEGWIEEPVVIAQR